MPIIDCNFKDPEGNDVESGELIFVANETNPPVLKSTSASITLTNEAIVDNDITLLACTYKVYYIATDTTIRVYIGEITVTTIDTTLVSLLDTP